MTGSRLIEKKVLANVGLRIAELREERGLKQVDLAVQMGVEPRNAQRYEAGGNLTLATLVRLANVLGVRPAAFFGSTKRRKRAPGRPTSKRTS